MACLNESFVAIKAIFSWNGFSDANLLSLRKRGLAIVGNRIENKNLDKSDSLKELVVEALEYLEGYHYFILNIGCATSYLKLCEVISSMCPSSDGEYIIPKGEIDFTEKKMFPKKIKIGLFLFFSNQRILIKKMAFFRRRNS